MEDGQSVGATATLGRVDGVPALGFGLVQTMECVCVCACDSPFQVNNRSFQKGEGTKQSLNIAISFVP